MINNYGCAPNDGTTCNVGPGPDREPIAAMLGMANDLTAKALIQQRISQFLGISEAFCHAHVNSPSSDLRSTRIKVKHIG